MGQVTVTNRGPNPLELRGVKAREPLLDADGKHVIKDGVAGYVDHVVETLQLEVGAFNVDGDKLAYILEHNPVSLMLFEAQCDVADEVQTEGTAEYKGGRVRSLSKLALKEAHKAIAACTDRELLRKWVMDDSRPEIRKALHLRDRDLNPGDKAEETALKSV